MNKPANLLDVVIVILFIIMIVFEVRHFHNKRMECIQAPKGFHWSDVNDVDNFYWVNKRELVNNETGKDIGGYVNNWYALWDDVCGYTSHFTSTIKEAQEQVVKCANFHIETKKNVVWKPHSCYYIGNYVTCQ